VLCSCTWKAYQANSTILNVTTTTYAVSPWTGYCNLYQPSGLNMIITLGSRASSWGEWAHALTRAIIIR
jgi:hypothetical protein